MEIITHPDDRLRRKAVDIPLEEIGTKELNDFIADMTAQLVKHNGLGLSACQVGSERNLFLMRVGKEGLLIFINPKIIARTGKFWSRQEGCLSVPYVRKDIKRSKVVKVNFLDEKGEEHTIKVDKMDAAIIQHEIDHLNGVLIIDRAA